MPPKKRGAPAKAEPPAPTTNTPSKGVANTAAASRPKRNSIANATAADPPKQTKFASSTKNARVTAENAPTALAPKKRSRPGRKEVEQTIEDAAEAIMLPETVIPELMTKKRGRPAKTATKDAAAEDSTAAAEPPAKRGRGAAKAAEKNEETEAEDEPEAPAKRGRGRPSTKAAEQKEETEAEEEPEAPAKRGRGRPSKKAEPAKSAEAAEEPSAEPKSVGRRGKGAKQAEAEPEPEPVKESAPKKRGRPSTKTADNAETDVEGQPAAKKGGKAKAASVTDTEAEAEEKPARGRGRPSKAKPAETAKEEAVPKKRGRPSASAVKEEEPTPPAKRARGRGKASTGTATDEQAAAQIDHELDEVAQETATKTKTASKGKGPAAGSRGKGKKGKKDALPADEEDDPSNEANPTEATTEIAGEASDDSGRQYWLMKAEPQDRIETTASGKEVNVKFSIDDLRAKKEPEPWEGIRNLLAQKNMREMKVGDRAFFYESNGKTPGVVGVMEIVEEVSTDETAFSQDSPYYDAKSDPNKPKWQLVHVVFRRKFPEKITLKELQKYAKSGGALENMQVIKSSRLSVSKVSAAEWNFIMSLVDEEAELMAEAHDNTLGSAQHSSSHNIASAAVETVKEAFESAANFASETLGLSHETPIVSEALASDLGTSEPLVQVPTVDEEGHAAMPSREIGSPPSEITVPEVLDTVADAGHGLLDSIKSAVGLGGGSRRSTSAKPASRAGSAKPTPARAGSRKPASRGSSAVPAGKTEGHQNAGAVAVDTILEEEFVIVEKQDAAGA